MRQFDPECGHTYSGCASDDMARCFSKYRFTYAEIRDLLRDMKEDRIESAINKYIKENK